MKLSSVLADEEWEALRGSVSISDHARSTLERETKNITTAHVNQELVDFQGHDGKVRLGLIALGKTAMDDWSGKGLEVTKESAIAAAEAFQDAFRKSLDERGSATAGTGISLKRHQIVINSQAVPDWFLEEYKSILSSIGDRNLKSAFQNGDAYFVSPPTVLHSEALSRYAEVKHITTPSTATLVRVKSWSRFIRQRLIHGSC